MQHRSHRPRNYNSSYKWRRRRAVAVNKDLNQLGQPGSEVNGQRIRMSVEPSALCGQLRAQRDLHTRSWLRNGLAHGECIAAASRNLLTYWLEDNIRLRG